MLERKVKEVFRVQLEGLARARGKITQARETTQALLHANALFAHRPKKARPAWAWGQDVVCKPAQVQIQHSVILSFLRPIPLDFVYHHVGLNQVRHNAGHQPALTLLELPP